MTKNRISRHTNRKKRRKRVGMFLRILALLLVSAVPLICLTTDAASKQEAQIQLRLKNGAILLGEEIPEFQVEVENQGDTKTVLNQETGYTAEDLLKELNEGKRYRIECDADLSKEGEYPLHLKLDDTILKALEKEWIGLVTIKTKDAVFQVKNPVGEWDGDKFKRYDGTYVTNDFVLSKENTYYFGEDGVKVTGWRDIAGSRYYFNSEGIRITGWQTFEDSKYYFDNDGKMSVGLQEIEGNTYYFGNDGKMETGDIYLGLVQYVFGEDGILQSVKESTVDPGKPMIALTFDDGPGPRTGEVLDALVEYHSHATFFMLGSKVPANADVVKRMKESGCELGNHSYDHPDLSKKNEDGVKNQIVQTNHNIQNAAGQGATVMRPPYGAVSSTVKASVGMPMILWNIDTLDWKTRNAQTTVDTVMKTVKDGDIILMHDIHTESVDAAIELIPKLIEKGYQLVTVSEMAAAKGITLQNGSTYTDF